MVKLPRLRKNHRVHLLPLDLKALWAAPKEHKQLREFLRDLKALWAAPKEHKQLREFLRDLKALWA